MTAARAVWWAARLDPCGCQFNTSGVRGQLSVVRCMGLTLTLRVSVVRGPLHRIDLANPSASDLVYPARHDQPIVGAMPCRLAVSSGSPSSVGSSSRMRDACPRRWPPESMLHRRPRSDVRAAILPESSGGTLRHTAAAVIIRSHRSLNHGIALTTRGGAVDSR